MTVFRRMEDEDAFLLFPMMRAFYDAHGADVADDVLWMDLDACLEKQPRVEGWVFAAGIGLAGYAMLTRGFDTATAAPTLRVEELYVEPAWRAEQIGESFLRQLPELYPDCVDISVPVPDNRYALTSYRELGYGELERSVHWKRNQTERPDRK